jgi:hypothetical protein
MPEISEKALMMSIQAIHQVTGQCSAEREVAVGSAQADYDEIIEACEIVAMELRTAYAQACAQDANLPPYASLVGG